MNIDQEVEIPVTTVETVITTTADEVPIETTLDEVCSVHCLYAIIVSGNSCELTSRCFA